MLTITSEGSEVACKCFGTHTGLIGECGPYYSTREAADNVADEVTVGHVIIANAASSEDGGAEAVDDGCGTLAVIYVLGTLIADAATI